MMIPTEIMYVGFDTCRNTNEKFNISRTTKKEVASVRIFVAYHGAREVEAFEQALGVNSTT